MKVGEVKHPASQFQKAAAHDDIVIRMWEVVDDEVKQVNDKVEIVAEITMQHVDVAQVNDEAMQKCSASPTNSSH